MGCIEHVMEKGELIEQRGDGETVEQLDTTVLRGGNGGVAACGGRRRLLHH
jgi:hypothetical protein